MRKKADGDQPAKTKVTYGGRLKMTTYVEPAMYEALKRTVDMNEPGWESRLLREALKLYLEGKEIAWRREKS